MDNRLIEPDATAADLDRSLNLVDAESTAEDNGHVEVIGRPIFDLVRGMFPAEHEMTRVDRALDQLRAELLAQGETIRRLSHWSI